MGAGLLAAGVTANPHPAARTDVVEPGAAAVALLAERRARMVALATAREGA